MITNSKNTTVTPDELSNVTGGFSVKAAMTGAIGGWKLSHEFYANPSWTDVGRGMMDMYHYADGGFAPAAAAQPVKK
jgi:hypothetical protein